MLPLLQVIVKHNNPCREAGTMTASFSDLSTCPGAITSGEGVGWTAGNDGSIIDAFLALGTVLRKRCLEMRQI